MLLLHLLHLDLLGFGSDHSSAFAREEDVAVGDDEPLLVACGIDEGATASARDDTETVSETQTNRE